MAGITTDERLERSYIRGYAEAIATLFDKKGGHKTAHFQFTWVQLRTAGVTEDQIERIAQFLESP